MIVSCLVDDRKGLAICVGLENASWTPKQSCEVHKSCEYRHWTLPCFMDSVAKYLHRKETNKENTHVHMSPTQ